MDYISSQEAAEKWGLTRRTVQLYCQNGKIPGAYNVGKQWLIPRDASKPLDGRFRENCNPADCEPYKFPLFVYSRHFLKVSELSDDERSLLEAQLLNLKCEYFESIRCCKRLISESRSPSIRTGALLTNLSNFMLLGLASEMSACMKSIDAICENVTTHQEDYRLLRAYADCTYRFHVDSYMKIDVSKLSPDALTTYKFMSMCVALFSDDASSDSMVNVLEAVCRDTELMGIVPASLLMHGMLALLYSRRGSTALQQKHIEEICRVGYESGFDRLVARVSFPDINAFLPYLRKYGSDYADGIKARCAQQWQRAFFALALNSGEIRDIPFNLAEGEFMILLAYKMPIRDIAELKNLSEKEVRRTIKELRTRFSVTSNKALVETFMKAYSVPAAEEMPAMSGMLPPMFRE